MGITALFSEEQTEGDRSQETCPVQLEKQEEHQDLPEPSACCSGSAHRPPLPSRLPRFSAFFFFTAVTTPVTAGYIPVCFCFLSVCPQSVTPWGQRDSSPCHCCFPAWKRKHLEPGGLQCLLLDGRGGRLYPPHHAAVRSVPLLICSFHSFPSEMHNFPSMNTKHQPQRTRKTTQRWQTVQSD